jgi:hypothetical protein
MLKNTLKVQYEKDFFCFFVILQFDFFLDFSFIFNCLYIVIILFLINFVELCSPVLELSIAQ